MNHECAKGSKIDVEIVFMCQSWSFKVLCNHSKKKEQGEKAKSSYRIP